MCLFVPNALDGTVMEKCGGCSVKNKTNKLTVCESVRFASLQALEGFGMTSKIHMSSMIMEETGWDGEWQSVYFCGGRVKG